MVKPLTKSLRLGFKSMFRPSTWQAARKDREPQHRGRSRGSFAPMASHVPAENLAPSSGARCPRSGLFGGPSLDSEDRELYQMPDL